VRQHRKKNKSNPRGEEGKARAGQMAKGVVGVKRYEGKEGGGVDRRGVQGVET